MPWWGKPSSPWRPIETGKTLPGWGGLNPALVDRLSDAEQGGLVHVEVDVHRVKRDDRGQERLVLVDQVPGGQIIAADVTVDRRLHLGEIKA